MTDNEFIDQVYNGCEDLIYKICMKYNVKGQETEDLCQLAIEELWKNKDNYNNDYCVTTWVHTITKRKMARILRRQDTLKRGSDDQQISIDKRIGENGNTFLYELLDSGKSIEKEMSYLLYEAVRDDLKEREMREKSRHKIIDFLDLLWFNLTEQKVESSTVDVKKEIAGLYGVTTSSIDWLIKNHIDPVAKEYI